MRVLFAGTPPFAATALEALAAAGHTIALVLSQPDRPAGRGMRLTPSAVSQAAGRLKLPVAKPPSLKEEGAELVRSANADCMVVAAYGLILPPDVLALPPAGCLNIHASLLPRWRGAAPIQRAILAGDAETGVCIMRMERGLDTGPVLLEKRCPIDPRDTAGTLTETLARLGAAAVVEALARLDELVPRPQPAEGVTYAAKIDKAEALIDWNESAAAIDRRVRALNPSPGAQTRLAGEMLKVWEARPVGAHGPPGEVLSVSPAGIVVAAGKGALEITGLQRAGGRRVSPAEFLAGRPLAAGSRLGAEA